MPEFDGASDFGSVQKLFETPHKSKKLDYYVEHFSKDPYVAYSEREEWMKENDLHLNKFRRRLPKGPRESSTRPFPKSSKTSKKQKRELKSKTEDGRVDEVQGI